MTSSERDEWNQFAALLRSLRQRQNWTQEQAAEKTGVSAPYLSQMERGQRRPPSREILRRLAYAYAVDEGVLLEAAGYGGKPKTSISPERIQWAFTAMCNDPAYTFGAKVRNQPYDLDTKAFLVEIYCHYTGRNLFASDDAVRNATGVNKNAAHSVDTDNEGDRPAVFNPFADSAAETWKCRLVEQLTEQMWPALRPPVEASVREAVQAAYSAAHKTLEAARSQKPTVKPVVSSMFPADIASTVGRAPTGAEKQKSSPDNDPKRKIRMRKTPAS